MMMTIEEVCARQRDTGNNEMYLRLKGVFWMAYDGAAFAVARITGYEVKRLKTVDRYELGFNEVAVEKVLSLMQENGFKVDDYKDGDELIRFSGGNAEVDESLVVSKTGDAGTSRQEIHNLLDLRRELLAINLADDQLDFRLLKETIRNLQIRCLSHIIL